MLEDRRFYNDVKERIRKRKQRLFYDKGVAVAPLPSKPPGCICSNLLPRQTTLISMVLR
jgi:hypothetical protein